MADPDKQPVSEQVTEPDTSTSASINRYNEHPFFANSQSIGMVSGESPRFDSENSGHQQMGDAIKAMGLQSEATHGRYETPENSYIVYGPTREQMYELGHKFGQESVVYGENGEHEMLFTNGPKAGRFHPSNPHKHEIFDEAPSDYFTYIPSMKKYARLSFDWDTLNPASLKEPHGSQALQVRAQTPVEKSIKDVCFEIAQTLRKFIACDYPHPHHYPWHNGNTKQNRKHCGHGVFSKAIYENQASPEHKMNTLDHSDFAQTSIPFGTIQGGHSVSENIPLSGLGPKIDQMIKDYGYRTHYYGNEHGRPQFAEKNYDTKHLAIYDPHNSEYVDNWRKLHELAHALTLPDVNGIYGEGERVGKLNEHDAIRSAHWEWLAMHKQRQLAETLGAKITDEQFNKDTNTSMHDAVYRTITNKEEDPNSRGFKPFAHIVPLETSLGMIRTHNHNLESNGQGVTKNEGSAFVDKELSLQEIKEALAKTLKERVLDYEKGLLELRKRELAKAEKIEHELTNLCKLCKKNVCKCSKTEMAQPSGDMPGAAGGVGMSIGKEELHPNKDLPGEPVPVKKEEFKIPKSKEINSSETVGKIKKGKIPSGRKMKKADVPMAKPPTTPTAPTSSKPPAISTSKPAAPEAPKAPGVNKSELEEIYEMFPDLNKANYEFNDEPYGVLGLRPGASMDEVKSSWKQLALKHHPDRGGNPQEMRRINEAYARINLGDLVGSKVGSNRRSAPSVSTAPKGHEKVNDRCDQCGKQVHPLWAAKQRRIASWRGLDCEFCQARTKAQAFQMHYDKYKEEVGHMTPEMYMRAKRARMAGSKVNKSELEKGDYGQTESGKPSTLPPPVTPEASKPKFQVKDLAAGKEKLQSAGIKPVSSLGLPKQSSNQIPVGQPPKIPAMAVAPGTPPMMPKGSLASLIERARSKKAN